MYKARDTRLGRGRKQPEYCLTHWQKGIVGMEKRTFRLSRRKSGVALAVLSSIAIAVITAGWQAFEPGSSGLVAVAEAQNAPATKPPANQPRGVKLNKMPVRVIKNEGAIFSAVAIDPIRNEVVLQDEANEKIMVYDRLTDTPKAAKFSEPKRTLGGKNTLITNNCGVYVDPITGEIYSITGDTSHNMAIFKPDQKGNVKPDRVLKTAHRTFGIAADEQAQELFLTTQWPPSIMVYRKKADEREAPLRILEGPDTKLATATGIAIDTKNQEMYVANWGPNTGFPDGKAYTAISIYGEGEYREWDLIDQQQHFLRKVPVPATGRIDPPSIAVFDLKAKGNTAPKRVIQGPNAQLNWPDHMYMDMDRRELYVANTSDNSILVFRGTDSGNAAPIRLLKGPKTEIDHPVGVFFDVKNQELYVANWGNNRAVVFSPDASGDVVPKRRIRTAPDGTESPMLANMGSMAYDSKRDQIIAQQ
jgi:DNA-binding beta-propeller fold protein YncE